MITLFITLVITLFLQHLLTVAVVFREVAVAHGFVDTNLYHVLTLPYLRCTQNLEAWVMVAQASPVVVEGKHQ